MQSIESIRASAAASQRRSDERRHRAPSPHPWPGRRELLTAAIIIAVLGVLVIGAVLVAVAIHHP